jgi:hypothetical protein
MVIRVASGTASASTSSIRPRVLVSVVAPVVGVTVQVPASKIDYIDLSVSAFADNSGRFKFMRDAVAVADGVSLLLAKSPIDTVSVTDESDISFGKVNADEVRILDSLVRTLIFIRSLDDAIELSDEVTSLLEKLAEPDEVEVSDAEVKDVEKSLTNLVGFLESVQRSFQKAVTDTALTTDATTQSAGKALQSTAATQDASQIAFSRPASDGFGVADNESMDFQKSLSSTQAVLDSLFREFSKSVADGFLSTDAHSIAFTRPVQDSSTTSETIAYGLSKTLADSFGFTHQVTRSLSRFISDGVAMNDSAETVDGLLVQSSKSVTNMAFVTDGSVILLSKSLGDSQALVDSGSLISQGYCDLTYLAEDYVGESRTF